MQKTLRVLLVLAAIAVLAYPVAVAADAAFGRDVILLTSLNDPDRVETEQLLFDPGLDGEARRLAVIAVYGLPGESASGPTRVLMPDDSRLIRPVEDPSLALLPAASAGGEYPIQAQSVRYISGHVTIVAGVAIALLLLLTRLTGKRSES